MAESRLKARRRKERRAGTVLFIEGAPAPLKRWLARRAAKAERTMSREALEILDAARLAERAGFTQGRGVA